MTTENRLGRSAKRNRLRQGLLPVSIRTRCQTTPMRNRATLATAQMRLIPDLDPNLVLACERVQRCYQFRYR